MTQYKVTIIKLATVIVDCSETEEPSDKVDGLDALGLIDYKVDMQIEEHDEPKTHFGGNRRYPEGYPE